MNMQLWSKKISKFKKWIWCFGDCELISFALPTFALYLLYFHLNFSQDWQPARPILLLLCFYSQRRWPYLGPWVVCAPISCNLPNTISTMAHCICVHCISPSKCHLYLSLFKDPWAGLVCSRRKLGHKRVISKCVHISTQDHTFLLLTIKSHKYKVTVCIQTHRQIRTQSQRHTQP